MTMSSFPHLRPQFTQTFFGADMFRHAAFAATLLIASLSIQLFGRPALAEDTTSALINQALDKQTKLALSNLLPQAMEVIEKQTGVPMKADPAVWDLIPR